MGAHTLGKATAADGVFNGSWTPDEEDVFNTNYYKNMISNGLHYVNKVFQSKSSRVVSERCSVGYIRALD